MESFVKRKPYNYEADDFWYNHFKYLRVLKFLFPPLIDFIQDKMYSAELSVAISGLYITNLDADLLGIYKTFSICEIEFPDRIDVPHYLRIKNPFSLYCHHFFFLVYLGNLRKCPMFITLISALFCYYDFLLILIDTIYCGKTPNDISSRYIYIYAYFRLALSTISIYYWTMVLIFKNKIDKRFGLINFLGTTFLFTLRLVCKCRLFSAFYKIIKDPFDYPIRIKCAGAITLGMCLTNTLAIIFYTHSIYKVIDDLQSYLHYLRDQPYEEIFILIRLHKEYIITVETGKKILKLLIELLLPIFPCVTVSIILGFMVAMLSILNMFYQYRRIILRLRSEGPDSEFLREIWKFRSYNSIYFCTQFVVNAFFLNYIFAISLFILTYTISFRETLTFLWDYLTSRKAGFYISFVPTVIGYIYFPFLIKKNNFIRNKYYFSFWDTWYFLIGTFSAFLKALYRYLIGLGSIILLGYRVETSIMPAPFDYFDDLYGGFYASIVVHCMKEGIIPLDLNEPLNPNESQINP